MRLFHGALTAAISLGLVVPCDFMVAQAPTQPQADPGATAETSAAVPASQVTSASAVVMMDERSRLMHCRPSNQEYEPLDEKMPCTQEAAVQSPAASADTPTPSPAPKTYTVPAGTKVLLELRSGINTKSAKPGDGVYLSSTFPVRIGNRVMIPAGVYVQGVVDHVVRAGHVKGKSQLDMHFTSIIFPNGTVVEIPGIVNSLPGASKQTVKDDGEGTIEQNADKGRNAGEVAKIAIPTGGTVGSIGGLAGGHPLAGGLAGIGAGAAAVGLVSLFTRGADVNIQSGTQVEMVLQRPLVLEEENLTGAQPGLSPAANQPKPLDKPSANLLCPPGSLGCQ
jgi:type IV secretion system protein VirB10